MTGWTSAAVQVCYGCLVVINWIGKMKQITELEDLIGLELASVTGGSVGDNEIVFKFTDGNELLMTHLQDCCESVSINDVDGDIQDLVGGVVVEFEEVSSNGAPEPDSEYVESYTWTFYKISTTKGFVNIRWLGESNGYYSERVSLLIGTGNSNDYVWGGHRGYKEIS